VSRRYFYSESGRARVTMNRLDAVFVFKRKRYYLDHHPYLGPSFYHDKWMCSPNNHVPNVIWRRWAKWHRKHGDYPHHHGKKFFIRDGATLLAITGGYDE